MALTYARPIIAIAFLATACGRPSEPVPAQGAPETLSVTRWTDKTELFTEYPPLVVNRNSRFAIHLTRLEGFKPLAAGAVEVHLRGGGQPDEMFRTGAPSRPGIFGVDVQPAHPGKRRLEIVLRAGGLEDQHDVGEVEVFSTPEAAHASRKPEEAEVPGIAFLKEQQWSLEFGTAIVTEQAVRESVRVPGRVEPRPGGAADVVAPIGGRLARLAELPLGAPVSRGQELARLLPPPSVPGDLPQLVRSRVEAETSLALATHDRERAERLTNAGAAPGRRLDEARAVEAQAKAKLAASQASLGQYNAARAGGSSDPDALFIVRSPLSGVIARMDAAEGANVTAGAPLFRVVDTAQVHIIGQVPEADAARARLAREAEIEVSGRLDRIPAGRLVSVGQVIDPQTRTVPITFAIDNKALALPVGQAVFLHLLMESAAPRPVVPAAAVVDDAGRPIVFVQRAGETFERRAVTLGPRAGDVVQVIDGVKPGDRIVVKGAYLVRLASLSTSVPAHGHVH